jgi:hypothetical protein
LEVYSLLFSTKYTRTEVVKVSVQDSQQAKNQVLEVKTRREAGSKDRVA